MDDRRALSRAALLVLAWAVSGCASREDASLAIEPIVNGMPASGDPAVVGIRGRDAHCAAHTDVFCSGILVAPRVVLTAAHCVVRASTTGTMEVSFGPDASPASTSVMVSRAISHPAYDPTTSEHDVAVLVLAEPAMVTPYPLPTAGVDMLTAGASLRAVGFGVTMRGGTDLGIKREGTEQLSAVRAASFDAIPGPGLTCTGDSGGPVFATIAGHEQLVGITARGDSACASSAFQVRVDAILADFLMPQITAAASAPLGWPPDGPRIADLATISCTTDADCPAIFTCEMGMTGSSCVLPALGAGTFAGTCTTDAECGPGGACARVWPSGPDACHCFAASVGPPPDPMPPRASGCSATHAGASGSWTLALAALAMLALGRRRSR